MFKSGDLRIWLHGMPAVVIAVAIAAFASVSSTCADESLRGAVDIGQISVPFLFGGNTGSGTLHYRGRSYSFSVSGLGVGGIGVTETTGIVDNMVDVSQFPGVYLALPPGSGSDEAGNRELWLENGSGVVLRLQGFNNGAGLTLGADLLTVSLIGPKSN